MTGGIWIDGKDLLVRPPKYPSTEVKEVLGGRWDKEAKAWRLAPTSLNVTVLAEWYGEEFIKTAPPHVQDLYFLPWGFRGWAADQRADAEKHPKWSTLYPFQKEAVEYLTCNPHRGALLSLSPGLGKTPTSIVAADLMGKKRILIVAPLTLTRNWQREIEAWSDTGRDVKRATAVDKTPGPEVTVTNFETLFYTILRDENGEVLDVDWVTNARRVKQWIDSGPKKRNPQTGKMVPARERIVQARPEYAEITWDLIISDESILLKNRKAVKVGILEQLAKSAHDVWLLSGSPTAKFRDDLYPQCRIIMPRAFPSYWRFAEFFCVVDRGQWGWTIKGDRPDRNPQRYLKDFLFIRNQKDVLPDLPDYIYNPVEVELTPQQQKAFDSMVDNWIVELETLEGEEDEVVEAHNRLAQLTRMQQITSNLCNLTNSKGRPLPANSAKENLLVEMIKQSDIEFPLLVWCWWVPTAHSVHARLTKEFKDLRVAVVTGEMKARDKDDTIDAFRGGELDVLVLQMGIGKFGHTFTETRTVFYHDRSFDSDAYLQSLRRVKRIGLKHRPRLIVPRAPKSADPVVELNLAGKLASIAKISNHDLLELLRSLGGQGFEWAMDTPLGHPLPSSTCG